MDFEDEEDYELADDDNAAMDDSVVDVARGPGYAHVNMDGQGPNTLISDQQPPDPASGRANMIGGEDGAGDPNSTYAPLDPNSGWNNTNVTSYSKDERFNLLMKFADLPSYLDSLGVTPEVKEFILSQPDRDKGRYVGIVRSNPQASVRDLQGRQFVAQDPVANMKKQYPQFAEQIDYLIQQDPSSNNRYLSWEVLQLAKGHSLNDILPTVSFYHNNTNKFRTRNIEQYSDLKELEDEAKAIGEHVSVRQQKRSEKGSAEKLYEDEKYVLIRPDSKDACVFYGRDTRWCITMQNQSHYENYTGSNVVFYFLINKKGNKEDPYSKVAFAMKRDFDNKVIETDIFNAEDSLISEEDVSKEINIYPQIKQIIDSDVVNVPKGVLAKMKDKEATNEEVNNYLSNLSNKEAVYIMSRFKNDSYSEVYQKYLMRASKDEDREVRSRVVFNPYVSSEVLTGLSTDEDKYIRQAVAQNRNTFSNDLTNLSTDEDTDIRIAVAKHPNTPPEALANFSKDEDTDIRIAVARNKDTPPEAFIILSKDEDLSVRIGVARNINAPIEVLEDLAKDEDRIVRAAVARNINAPIEVLEDLAKDEDRIVRQDVAKHPNTPPEVLLSLLNDPGYLIRTYVIRNTNMPPDTLAALSKDEDSKTRQDVAQNINTPIEVLEDLAKDNNYYVRAMVAMNRNATPKILTDLSKDSDKWIREIVSKHNNTPAEALVELSKDENEFIRKDVARRLEYMKNKTAYTKDERMFLLRKIAKLTDQQKDEIKALLNKILLTMDEDDVEAKGINPDDIGSYQERLTESPVPHDVGPYQAGAYDNYEGTLNNGIGGSPPGGGGGGWGGIVDTTGYNQL